MHLFLILPASLTDLISRGITTVIRPAMMVSESEEAARAEYTALYEIKDGDYIICHLIDRIGDYKILVEKQES